MASSVNEAQRMIDELLWKAAQNNAPQVVEDLIQKHQANKNQAERAMVYLVGLGNLGHSDSSSGSTCVVWLEVAILHQLRASSFLCYI
ncbi:unnamed protein product [Cladocopium goreaui]|uniref:Uncharacterized protein n=1 Tax=Cladocopium goreaui TaxID=2562237 RepID=A0A9P1D453_9DINO|nr:unnamed protein product [Cladocopium goreaui]